MRKRSACDACPEPGRVQSDIGVDVHRRRRFVGAVRLPNGPVGFILAEAAAGGVCVQSVVLSRISCWNRRRRGSNRPGRASRVAELEDVRTQPVTWFRRSEIPDGSWLPRRSQTRQVVGGIRKAPIRQKVLDRRGCIGSGSSSRPGGWCPVRVRLAFRFVWRRSCCRLPTGHRRRSGTTVI